jgi:hypothetical protein
MRVREAVECCGLGAEVAGFACPVECGAVVAECGGRRAGCLGDRTPFEDRFQFDGRVAQLPGQCEGLL